MRHPSNEQMEHIGARAPSSLVEDAIACFKERTGLRMVTKSQVFVQALYDYVEGCQPAKTEQVAQAEAAKAADTSEAS